MRQIGVRDEAKLLADYGDCGKPVCCNTHMTTMPPVSMRMAKLQKSTLDPSKISGRCGRLKCCLRFEQEVYEEHQAELPSVGTRVVTPKGQGRVLAQEILARKVLVEFEDGRRLPVPAAEILGLSENEDDGHVSARQLLDGVRDLARREFGLMARAVFRMWNIHRTDDV